MRVILNTVMQCTFITSTVLEAMDILVFNIFYLYEYYK